MNRCGWDPSHGETRPETHFDDTRLQLLAPRINEGLMSLEETVVGERTKGLRLPISFPLARRSRPTRFFDNRLRSLETSLVELREGPEISTAASPGRCVAERKGRVRCADFTPGSLF